MKRWLSLLLCLVMLAALLAGCGDSTIDGPGGDSSSSTTDPSPDVQPLAPDEGRFIDASEWTIVRSDPQPATVLLTAAVKLRTDLSKLTNVNVSITDDWLQDGEDATDACEILIGNVNRPETAAALATLNETGYVICTSGNKIVIVGTTDAITAEAVSYFYENYVLPNVQEGGFRIPETLNVVNTDFKLVQMLNGKKCLYDVVYLDGLDATLDEKGKLDYQVKLAQNVRQKIIDLTNANIRITTDWSKPGTDVTSNYEILVGNTSRPESAQVRAEYAVNEYGFKVMGNKIVVTGWNEEAIGYAVEMFLKFLENSVVENADGTKNICFLADYSETKSFSRWTVDIPEYEGGVLEGCVTCNNDQLEYYYTGTTADEYRAYRQKLENEGYELYFENEIAGNLYATYTNKSNMIHVYYVKYNNAVRLITGSTRSSVVLPTNLDGPSEYTKITESKVTQMMLQYDAGNFGMCYIITLEDGSFIVFDGGGHTEGQYTDYVRLFNLLDELNERKDGKIVIAAGIITHVHWDHHKSFFKMCKTYGSKLTIEQCIVNAPDSIVYYNSYNPESFMSSDFSKAASAVGGITWVKPHTGMKFWVRNAQIEVLYTQEDLYPEPLHTFNNSSMVTRMTIGDQVITWLGDIQTEGSNIITSMYGDYLKTDIAQVSHHGYNGATQKLYKLLSPDTLLWPTSSSGYSKQTAGTSSSSYYVVDYYIAKQLGVKDIYVADGHNICLTLPHKPGDQVKYVDVAAG